MLRMRCCCCCCCWGKPGCARETRRPRTTSPIASNARASVSSRLVSRGGVCSAVFRRTLWVGRGGSPSFPQKKRKKKGLFPLERTLCEASALPFELHPRIFFGSLFGSTAVWVCVETPSCVFDGAIPSAKDGDGEYRSPCLSQKRRPFEKREKPWKIMHISHII